MFRIPVFTKFKEYYTSELNPPIKLFKFQSIFYNSFQFPFLSYFISFLIIFDFNCGIMMSNELG